MKTKPKVALIANRIVETDKYSNKSLIINPVKSLLSSGEKLTAVEINRITSSNDARKVISTLRSEGWNIVDLRLPDNRKLYWLESSINQLELFMKGGEK